VILFLDANVLFTAAYSPTGISRALIDLADAGICALSISAYALEEARRNLELKKPEKIPDLERLLRVLIIVPEPSPDKVQWAQGLPLPPKDAPVMAAAIACGADILVTGDHRDFGHLLGTEVRGVKVLAPREALKAVLDEQNSK
jgi:predicted nucleic acid-binding protein